MHLTPCDDNKRSVLYVRLYCTSKEKNNVKLDNTRFNHMGSRVAAALSWGQSEVSLLS